MPLRWLRPRSNFRQREPAPSAVDRATRVRLKILAVQRTATARLLRKAGSFATSYRSSGLPAPRAMIVPQVAFAWMHGTVTEPMSASRLRIGAGMALPVIRFESSETDRLCRHSNGPSINQIVCNSPGRRAWGCCSAICTARLALRRPRLATVLLRYIQLSFPQRTTVGPAPLFDRAAWASCQRAPMVTPAKTATVNAIGRK